MGYTDLGDGQRLMPSVAKLCRVKITDQRKRLSLKYTHVERNNWKRSYPTVKLNQSVGLSSRRAQGKKAHKATHSNNLTLFLVTRASNNNLTCPHEN